MKKLKNFLNYNENIHTERYANQFHHQVKLILNKILNWWKK